MSVMAGGYGSARDGAARCATRTPVPRRRRPERSVSRGPLLQGANPQQIPREGIPTLQVDAIWACVHEGSVAGALLVGPEPGDRRSSLAVAYRQR